MSTSDFDRLSILDLYCGLGGLSLGFEMTDAYEVVGGIDNYDWAVKTFYDNHPEIDDTQFNKPIDLSSVAAGEIRTALTDTPDVVVGGPPCQGWSDAGKRYEDYKKDDRNSEVFNFLSVIKSVQPKAFVMENVAGISRTGQSSRNQILERLKEDYEQSGYAVTYRVLDSSEYRVPQTRKRLFMVGIRDADTPFRFPDVPCSDNTELFSGGEPKRTVGDALSDLPTPVDDEPQDYEDDPNTSLQRFLRGNSNELHNHLVTNHQKKTVEKISQQEVGTTLHDWNHSWYRLDPKKPSPTIKHNNRAPAVHHEEHRIISPRECCRLQTIPDWVELKGTKTAQLKLVGNAVPSILAAHLATAIAKQAFGISVPSPWSSRECPFIHEETTESDKAFG